MTHEDYILKILRQRKGLDKNDSSKDEDFEFLSCNDIFYEVTTWEGLINYDETIKKWIKDIYDIDLDNV